MQPDLGNANEPLSVEVLNEEQVCRTCKPSLAVVSTILTRILCGGVATKYAKVTSAVEENIDHLMGAYGSLAAEIDPEDQLKLLSAVQQTILGWTQLRD
eukprot:s3262_g4.t1